MKKKLHDNHHRSPQANSNKHHSPPQYQHQSQHVQDVDLALDLLEHDAQLPLESKALLLYQIATAIAATESVRDEISLPKALPCIAVYLTSTNEACRGNACDVLAALASKEKHAIDMASTPGLVRDLTSLLSPTQPFLIRSQACNAFANFVYAGYRHGNLFPMLVDSLESLVQCLDVPSNQVPLINSTLYSLTNLQRYKQAQKRLGKCPALFDLLPRILNERHAVREHEAALGLLVELSCDNAENAEAIGSHAALMASILRHLDSTDKVRAEVLRLLIHLTGTTGRAKIMERVELIKRIAATTDGGGGGESRAVALDVMKDLDQPR